MDEVSQFDQAHDATIRFRYPGHVAASKSCSHELRVSVLVKLINTFLGIIRGDKLVEYLMNKLAGEI